MPRDVRTHTFGGVASGGGAFYEGSPGDAASPSEPNVLGQWLMDEASGAIVDKVAALSCAVTGTPTYNVLETGSFAGWSPGITYADAGTQKHLNGTPGTQFNLGASTNVTIELAFTKGAITGTRFLCSFYTDLGGGYHLRLNSAGSVIFTLTASDLTSVAATYNLPATWSDGKPHKIRAIGDRTALLAKIYCDGLLLGTPTDLSILDGLTINGPSACIGNHPTASQSAGCTIWYVRVSGNTTNNCGGPGGG